MITPPNTSSAIMRQSNGAPYKNGPHTRKYLCQYLSALIKTADKWTDLHKIPIPY